MTGMSSVFSTPVWQKLELHHGETADSAAARCEKWNIVTSLYIDKFIYRLAAALTGHLSGSPSET